MDKTGQGREKGRGQPLVLAVRGHDGRRGEVSQGMGSGHGRVAAAVAVTVTKGILQGVKPCTYLG